EPFPSYTFPFVLSHSGSVDSTNRGFGLASMRQSYRERVSEGAGHVSATASPGFVRPPVERLPLAGPRTVRPDRGRAGVPPGRPGPCGSPTAPSSRDGSQTPAASAGGRRPDNGLDASERPAALVPL